MKTVGPLLSLLWMAVLGTGCCQGPPPPQEADCSSKLGYGPGSQACCGNFVFGAIHHICCTDPNTGDCWCDVARYPVCASALTSPPPSQTLCRSAGGPSRRLLGSTTVSDACSGRGVVNLNIGGSQFCNAVFAVHPVSGQRVLYTLPSCWDAVAAAMENDVPATGTIFHDSFPLDNCTVTEATTSGNVMMLTLSTLAAFFVEKHVDSCPSPGCVYSSDVMRDAINLNDCFIVSYGFSSLVPNTATGGEASRVSVRVSDVTQCRDAVSGSQCFVSASGGAGCLGDDGAPVYCGLSTGEVALYGIASPPNGCSLSDTSFNVIPITA